MSLIGKIGGSSALDTGAPLPGGGFVGTHASLVAPASGRLFLGFNDQRQAFDDNSGAFTVTLRLGC